LAQAHLLGRKHKLALAAKAYGGDHCKVCQVTAPTTQFWKLHIESKKHQKLLRKGEFLYYLCLMTYEENGRSCTEFEKCVKLGGGNATFMWQRIP
jgi:hypothetical protein